MSMVNLLRLHGVRSPRIVTAVGGIVIGGSSSDGLRVTPHKFHGGDDTPDNGGPWWTAPGALDRDREAMANWFPTFVELEGGSSVPPAWEGVINTGRGSFAVTIRHRLDHGVPHVVPAHHNLGRERRGVHVDPPHVFLNGNLCIASVEDWDSDRDTVATAVAWTAHWFACYVEWRLSGQWPVEGIEEDVHEAA